MLNLIREIRHAARMLWRARGFSLAALVSLAVGIAASTAIFSVVYCAVLNPFPYRDMWGVVYPRIQDRRAAQSHYYHSPEEVRAFTNSGIFAETMVWGDDYGVWSGNGDPERLRIISMSAGGFQFLGVPPLLGRTIGASDIGAGTEPEPVVVLSYAQWQRKFAGDPNVLGRKILLDDKPYEVIGVMPPRFTWHGRESVWLPLAREPKPSDFRQFLGRLKPGISLQSAGQRLLPLVQNLAREHPAAYPRNGFTLDVISFKDFNVASGELRRSLTPLLVAVGLLLLIACSNVANLLLARATTRRREIAIRTALGAGRARVIRQMLVESTLLALGGAFAGALLARAGLQFIVRLIPPFNLPDEAVIALNGTVLLFCAGVSVLTGILFGLAPAFEGSRVELQEALKDAARGQTDARRGGKLRGALVVTELTLSTVLLISAALTLRSFIALESVDLGLRPEHVLVSQVTAPSQRYRTIEQRNLFFRQVTERLASLPEVRSAAVSVNGIGGIGPSAVLRGSSLAAPGERIGVVYASVNFFQVLSIPVRRGRTATADEVRRGDRVAVVNETAVRQFWSGGDPLGRNVTLGFDAQGAASAYELPVTVIGIVGDTRNNGLTNPPRAAIFLPSELGPQQTRAVAIQTAGKPEGAIAAVRAAIHEVDRALPVAEPNTLAHAMDSQRVGPRFMSVLSSIFGTMGLILAACGIYGVISYSVSRRTYEFGIRMALGAQRADILSGVMRSGMKLAAGGVVLGLVASYGLARFYRDFISHSTYLSNFNENDPWAIAGVSLGLLAVALAACYFPARRAASADPVKSLRYE